MRNSILCLAIIVLFSGVVYPIWGDSWPGLLFGNVSQIAGLLCATRSFNKLQYSRDRRDAVRKGFGLCSLGAFIWLLAQIMEIYCELVLKLIAYGTIADAIWIIGYFPLIRGLYLISAHSAGNGKGARVFFTQKGLILILLLLYSAMYYLLILPQMKDSGQRLEEKILDFGYPTLDFILVGLSAFLMKLTKPGERFFRLALLLLAGFTMTLAGDAILSLVKDFDSFLYVSVDVYYFVSYFLMAIAADLEMKFTTDPKREYAHQMAV